jgi:hypothetical protein
MKKKLSELAAELSVTEKGFDLVTVKTEDIMCTGMKET